MSNPTLGMIILIAATLVIVYQIVAYLYFFISVSLVYTSTRKITKMPGLSFFFFISSVYSFVLFYPTTLIYFTFLAPSRDSDAGHTERINQTYLGYGSVGHIVISVVIMILWCIALAIQFLNAFLTTQLSTQRLVSWSSVEPYTRLTFLGIKIYQAIMITFAVSLFA